MDIVEQLINALVTRLQTKLTKAIRVQDVPEGKANKRTSPTAIQVMVIWAGTTESDKIEAIPSHIRVIENFEIRMVSKVLKGDKGLYKAKTAIRNALKQWAPLPELGVEKLELGGIDFLSLSEGGEWQYSQQIRIPITTIE